MTFPGVVNEILLFPDSRVQARLRRLGGRRRTVPIGIGWVDLEHRVEHLLGDRTGETAPGGSSELPIGISGSQASHSSRGRSYSLKR